MHNCLKLMYQTRFTETTHFDGKTRTTKYRSRKPDRIKVSTFSRLVAAGYLIDAIILGRGISPVATITAKGRGYAKRYRSFMEVGGTSCHR